MRDHDITELLGYFQYLHLPERLQKISEPFCRLAYQMVNDTPNDSYALKLGLEKLVEAKDCFVRATLNVKP